MKNGFGLSLLMVSMLLGCGGGGGGGGGGVPAPPPGGLSTDIVYEKYRDVVTGLVTPVVTESGSGFDALEVDSAAIAIDAARPGGDRFLLYYEATNGGGTSQIGVVTSDEEDFLTFTIGRTLVIGTGGGGSGFDVGATDPTVVVDKRASQNPAQRYKMWFEGRSGAGGAVSRIIYAESADGVTWGSFSICTGLDATFGSLRVADPSVVLDDDTFKMWFEAVNSGDGSGGDGPGRFGYAESANGITWQIRDAAGNTGPAAGPVFFIGAAESFDGYSVNSPSVLLDETVAVGVVGRFKLWYEAGDQAADTTNTIGYAVSADGRSWSDPQLPVLRPSSDSIVPLPFDSGDLEHPSAVIIDTIPNDVTGHFLLYYTGDGENGASPNRIGLALGRAGP